MANLSKIKRERMIEFLEKLKSQHNDDESIIAFNNIEKELTAKKFGLVWEEHEEAIDTLLESNIPVYSESNDKSIVTDSTSDECNFIIEGDNLAALRLLQKTHLGKIDLIYIDPPYNTLSEGFVYSDALVDKNDLFQHSKWSSMMYSRLKIAKRLLTKRGTIFISIDDNELYALKLICDEIFGPENYISTIIVIVKPEGRRYGSFAKTHEYILVYANNIEYSDLGEILVEGSKYQYYDELGGFNLKGLRNRNVRAFNSTNRPNLRYPFYVDINNPDSNNLCEISTEPKPGFIEVWASVVDGLESVWRWGKETAALRINELVAYEGNDGEIRIAQKERKLTQTPKTLWNEKEFISQKGTKEVQDILGKGAFDFPKPLSLIKRIVSIATSEDSIVLDFFAGSGTTGHAVMEINKEDGGSRRFILCNNNENGICEDVTYQRIKTVITGKRSDGSIYSDGLSNNLKYYVIKYIPKDHPELIDLLTDHSKEMVQIENGRIINKSDIVFISSDEDVDKFESNHKQYSNNAQLYINQDVLFTSTQEKLLEQYRVKTIPDSYFEKELRDLGEIW